MLLWDILRDAKFLSFLLLMLSYLSPSAQLLPLMCATVLPRIRQQIGMPHPVRLASLSCLMQNIRKMHLVSMNYWCGVFFSMIGCVENNRV